MPVFFRHGIADRVRNVDGSRAFIDHGLHHLAEEIEIRPRGVFRRKLNVVAVRARQTHGFASRGNALLARHFQFGREMNIRGSEN